MAQVTLRINGHAYTIGCNDGEEPHVMAMGEELEKRIERVKSLGAHSGESRLLVMAALFMADELHDMRVELEALRKGKPALGEKPGGSGNGAKSERIGRLAARAEEIAASAERH